MQTNQTWDVIKEIDLCGVTPPSIWCCEVAPAIVGVVRWTARGSPTSTHSTLIAFFLWLRHASIPALGVLK